MGVLTLLEVEGILLGVDVLAAVFLGCTLYYVYKTASGVVVAQRQRASSLTGINDVLCPCIFGRYTTLQYTMGCTVATVGSFFLATVMWVVAESTWFVICSDCDKNSDHKRTNTVAGLRAVAAFFVGIGYLLMLTSAFERLRLTFSGTVMQLPKWAPKALYAVCCLGFTFFFLGVATITIFVNPHPIVTATFVFLFLVNYLFSFLTVVVLFFKKTMAIASHSRDDNSRVIDTAVRITICVSLSLLSSCITTLSWIPGQMLCPTTRCLISRVVLTTALVFDICLNSFCLMCTFAGAQRHYQRAFGGLHAIFRARIAVANGCVATRQRAATATEEPR